MITPETTARPAGRADIQAVDRVGQILGLFTDDTTYLTTNGVAAALGLNRTTAHRYLSSMTAEDLLQVRADPPGYGLGSLILRLGGLAIGKSRVVAISAERMARLAEEVGTTISLSLWTPGGPVVARVQEPQGRAILLTFRVGTVLPFDTAQAVVLLAFRQDADEVEEAIGSLPEPARSITRSKVGEVRRTGLATAVSEVNGTCGLAAPIFDGAGVCAALAIVDTIGSISNSGFSHRLGRLQEAAQDLTARLGGAAPDWTA